MKSLIISLAICISGCATTVNPLQKDLDTARADNARLQKELEERKNAEDVCARSEAKASELMTVISEKAHEIVVAVEAKANAPETKAAYESAKDKLRHALENGYDEAEKFVKEHSK